MGLANDVELHMLKIDYSKYVAEVYHEFAVCEIKISLRLDLITKVQHDNRNRFNLPSWVPDWTFNKRGHVRLQNIRRPEHRYSASLNSQANVSFVPGTGHIRMKGLQVGVITYLGMPTSMQSPEDWKNGVVAIRS
ncbi:hypothetical protein OCU04_003374 [Sclerotinia nivalis]|uniref:Uncharacterized protein n=1 Tax=Sclerotinia nivalis TaxID=352851 RepID=A0A9X0DP78_9HELO|nr:hypothetical protein OCU04_003374 [Sclerotinia nivalis]